jgi:AcrR family transcriptional regulator
MQKLRVHIEISPELYFKNPDSSELGRKIISHSIKLIDEIGFESFTFKKLGQFIGSPESSIYRYFENKHVLLVYLINWYWTWTEYRIVFSINNIASAKERLEKALSILTLPVVEDHSISYVNEMLLSKIIFSEAFKGLQTKNVDAENKRGFFESYKSIVNRVSDIITEISPSYPYPHMLVSTVIEGAHQQQFFAEHIPMLTNVTNANNTIFHFYNHLVFNSLNSNENN